MCNVECKLLLDKKKELIKLTLILLQKSLVTPLGFSIIT